MSQSCLLTHYSFANVAATINGREIKGFWEGDDAVSIEPGADTATPMVGVDGAAVISLTVDQSVRVTLRLQQNSNGHQALQDRYIVQRQSRFSPFHLSIRDTGNGEGGNSAQAVIMRSPTATKGAAATSREWLIFAQCWIENKINYDSEVAPGEGQIGPPAP